MKTSIKRSYGRRKRHSGSPSFEWDHDLDSVRSSGVPPESKLSSKSSRPMAEVLNSSPVSATSEKHIASGATAPTGNGNQQDIYDSNVLPIPLAASHRQLIARRQQSCPKAEVELEPRYSTRNPRTPTRRVIIDHGVSPKVTPEHCAVFDMISTNTGSQALQPSNIRPKRLLDTIGRSKRRRILPRTSLHDPNRCQPVPDSLESLLAQTENSLVNHAEIEEGRISTKAPPVHTATTELQGQTMYELSSSRITYSKQRSFLMDPDSLVEEGTTITAALTPSQASPNKDEPQALPQPQPQPQTQPQQRQPSTIMKDVHDLRQGGENRRFIDEVSYLLDGLTESKTVQGSLIELSRKLASTEFALKFRAAGFEAQVNRASLSVYVQDPISLFSLMVIMSVSLQGIVESNLSLLRMHFIEIALTYQDDLMVYINDKRMQTSNINRSAAKALRVSLSKSEAFTVQSAGYRFSPRFLALTILSLHETIPAEFLSTHLVPLSYDYAHGSSETIFELRLICSLLEALPLESAVNLSEADVEQICSITSSLIHQQQTKFHTDRKSSLVSLLKFLITWSNGGSRQIEFLVNLSLTDTVLGYVLTIGHLSTETADEIVLSLGLLVCLAEESEKARNRIGSFNVKTKAGKSIPASTALLDMLRSQLPDSIHDSVTGYLALLIFHQLDTFQIAKGSSDISIVRVGLELLKRGTSDVQELQIKLNQQLEMLREK